MLGFLRTVNLLQVMHEFLHALIEKLGEKPPGKFIGPGCLAAFTIAHFARDYVIMQRPAPA